MALLACKCVCVCTWELQQPCPPPPAQLQSGASHHAMIRLISELRLLSVIFIRKGEQLLTLQREKLLWI